MSTGNKWIRRKKNGSYHLREKKTSWLDRLRCFFLTEIGHENSRVETGVKIFLFFLIGIAVFIAFCGGILLFSWDM